MKRKKRKSLSTYLIDLKTLRRFSTFARFPTLASLALFGSLNAQTVSGHVESVPSMTTPKAKVTFVNKSTQEKYATLTDSLTGDFSLAVPPGTYTEIVEALNNFNYQDTSIAISSDLVQNLQIIHEEPVQSTYYNNILALTKELTGTRDPPYQAFPLLIRFSQIPLREHPRDYDPLDSVSMPQSPIDFRSLFDSVKTMFKNKSNSKVQFRDASTDSAYGIEFVYPKNADMPVPGVLGWTDFISGIGTELLKMKCYINREENTTTDDVIRSFLKEFVRALGYYDASIDPQHIMYEHGSSSTVLSNDESYVLQITYSLDHGTDMTKYREIIPSTISRAPVVTHKLSSLKIPRNTSNNIFVSKLLQDVTDPDGDLILYNALSDNADIASTVSHDSLFVRKTADTESAKIFVTYKDTTGLSTNDTLEVMVNNPPPASAITEPGDTAHFDVGKLLIQYQLSVDVDGDQVRYIVNVNGSGLDTTFVDSLNVLFKDLDAKLFEPSTPYDISIKTFDGWDTTATASKQFTTPAATFIDAVVNVSRGWNIVSVPVDPVNKSKNALFPTSISNAFTFANGYVVKDSLDPGVGYWLKFSTTQNVTVTGTPKDKDTITVHQGWNMIGAANIAVAAIDVVSIPSGIRQSEFFGYKKGFEVADTLRSGQGYWVKVRTMGKLILSK